MKEIQFSVAAKAARLIGRENIADVDGALVELIKNAYDADASCVMVKMHIPFPDVPNDVELAFMTEIIEPRELGHVLEYYNQENGKLLKKDDLSETQILELRNILFKYNRIVIADNGCGMTSEIVSTTWMHIGTSDKESNIVSDNGRIKTGAKGIGRFALDKLSKSTLMYTKSSKSENVISWMMDWDQFANVKLIDDVKATVGEEESLYETLVREEFNDKIEVLNKHDWSTGTMIELSPIREPWSKRLFKKVNTNLNSINPIGSVDTFEVLIDNEFYKEFQYSTEEVEIDKDDYDYRILVEYDGNENLVVKLLRNEVNLSVKRVTIEKYGHSTTKNINEFWERKKLQVKDYKKEDYNKEIIKSLGVKKILPEDEMYKIQEVGPFEAEMYFLRNANSSSPMIMKRVATRKRKDLLNRFSGIKIYRDDFKVRPYGDEGALYDWIGLGTRAQKSPAAPSHQTGRWRVEPYQMIGWVKIGRETNPKLEDMANREGIALTDTYYIFVNLLQAAIDEFEYDRQYIYREYASWIDSIEKELADVAERVKEEARRRTQKDEKSNTEDVEGNQNEGEEFSQEDLFRTVQILVDESEKELQSKQMLQILSASGIILNTFFHEFNAINTQFHIQAPQIRSRINYILQGKEYSGLPAYNPYTRIDTLEKNDKLLAAFLDVVMEGLKKESREKRNVLFQECIKNILKRWELLLEGKHIRIRPNIFETEMVSDYINIALIDVYIILNNFLLNSAWFLEESHNPEREVSFELWKEDGVLCLLMENNGPSLDEKYRDNPNKIFEIGETSKGESGTGLGLWIVKETVERNNGSIEVLKKEDGFGLKISLKER